MVFYFSRKISVEVCLYNHLAVEFVHQVSESCINCIMYRVYESLNYPKIEHCKVFFEQWVP